MRQIDNKIYLYSIILLFFIGHLVYLNTPFVNLEWVYKIGSYYFMTSEVAYLDIYLDEQANPITYSFFSSLVTYLFGDNFLSYRMLALTGGTLILVSLTKYKDPFLLIIIGLNPLIWIYSGRAYSELLSAGLLVLAIEMNNNKTYFKGMTAALAASVKFHTMLFSGPYWALKWLEDSWRERSYSFKNHYFLAALYSSVLFIIFLLIYFYTYDVWIIPDKYKTALDLKSSTFLDNFFSYGFYLSALFCLTAPHFLKNSSLKSHFIALTFSIPLAFLSQDNGEMNFGSLDQLLGAEVILIIKIVGFWNFLLCMELFMKNDKMRVLALAILIYLTLISFTRPAQRYLIFIIPFWALLITQSKLHIHVFYKLCYVALLLFMAIFTSLYQIENAKASKEIANWSESNNKYIDTNVIYPHIGDSPYHSWDSDLIVQMNVAEKQTVEYSSEVSLLGFEIRKYYVVSK